MGRAWTFFGTLVSFVALALPFMVFANPLMWKIVGVAFGEMLKVGAYPVIFFLTFPFFLAGIGVALMRKKVWPLIIGLGFWIFGVFMATLGMVIILYLSQN